MSELRDEMARDYVAGNRAHVTRALQELYETVLDSGQTVTELADRNRMLEHKLALADADRNTLLVARTLAEKIDRELDNIAGDEFSSERLGRMIADLRKTVKGSLPAPTYLEDLKWALSTLMCNDIDHEDRVRAEELGLKHGIAVLRPMSQSVSSCRPCHEMIEADAARDGLRDRLSGIAPQMRGYEPYVNDPSKEGWRNQIAGEAKR